MKCKEFKYFLLGCENPDQPPADVKAHLASCADCQDWQNRLALIELNVPFLPVPESAARSDLLRRILSQPAHVRTKETKTALAEQTVSGSEAAPSEPKPSKLISTVGSERRDSRTRRGMRIWAVIRDMEPSARRYATGAVAAAILLVSFAWTVIRTPQRPVANFAANSRLTSDPLVATILQRDLRLAEAENAADRFRALALLADDFSDEVKNLAPVPEAREVLDDMVMKYEKVVNDGLVEVAKDLPGGERVKLLNEVGDRLHKTGREVEELGVKLSPRIPKASRETLQRLSQIAYDGDKKLRDLREVSVTQPIDGRPTVTTVLVRKERP
jgi:hypothetical protein